MNKVPATALAFAIFISSAAAEPIKTTDGALELIHAGENNSFSVTQDRSGHLAALLKKLT